MIANYPNYKPTSEKRLKQMLFSMGATEETLFKHMDLLNKRWDNLFAKMPGGKMHEIGVRCCLLFSSKRVDIVYLLV